MPELLLWRSATVSGFFLLHYAALYRKHLQKLVAAWQAGKLHVALDSEQFRCSTKASNLFKERSKVLHAERAHVGRALREPRRHF